MCLLPGLPADVYVQTLKRRFATGVHLLRAPILVPANMEVRGAGMGKTIVRPRPTTLGTWYWDVFRGFAISGVYVQNVLVYLRVSRQKMKILTVVQG